MATVKPCGMYDVQWLVADSEIMAALSTFCIGDPIKILAKVLQYNILKCEFMIKC